MADEKSQASQKPLAAQDKSAGQLSPFDEMDRFFNQFFSRGWLSPFSTEWPLPSIEQRLQGLNLRMPSIDVADRDDAIVIHAEMPGVDKKNLDISLTDTHVTIKGHAQTREEKKDEKANYLRTEIRRGEFARTVPLPAKVDASKAFASFKDGILELTLPKTQKSQRQSIKVE